MHQRRRSALSAGGWQLPIQAVMQTKLCLGLQPTSDLRRIESSTGRLPRTDSGVLETGALRAIWQRLLTCSFVLPAKTRSLLQSTSVSHRSQHAFFTNLHKMAKLLVLAACTSALLQQPARRISLTPRMGVVKPCVEINQ